MQKQHDFRIVGGDTDSIMFCKQDMSPFSKQEQKELLDEINSMLPDLIKFENDGVFSKVLYLKAKNYIMVDEKGKRTMKGSSLKSSTLEPALKKMLNEMIDAILFDNIEGLKAIYLKYVMQVRDGITDIKQWASKKSLSPTTFNSERKNETKIVDALVGSEYKSGDRVWLFPLDDKLILVENFKGEYDREVYYKKLYRATERFETILPVKEMFLNYALKKNVKLIEELK